MIRVLFVLIWLALSVYAIADWARTHPEEMPARLPRMAWLVILVVTVPLLSLGSLAWVVMRAVASAEQKQARASHPAPPVAPDDDPEFLFRLSRDIQRERKARPAADSHLSPTPSEGETSDAPSSSVDEAPAGEDASSPDPTEETEDDSR